MPAPTARPLWSRIHSATTNVVDLTATTIAYAKAYAAAVVEQRVKERDASQSRPRRFKEVDDDNGQFADGPDDYTIASDAPFTDHLASCAARVFKMPSLRKEQPEAVERIIFDPSCGGKLLLCIRTGGGKSLTLYLTAVSIGGISLVIIPLLSLTANQLERLKKALQRDGNVFCVHLDDAARNDVKQKVIPKMDKFKYASSTTFFILCSPQYIAENVDFRQALLRARDRRVLRLIAIDEVHIYAMHGRSFRDSIRVLQREFFSKLFLRRSGYSPLFLVMTATMPLSLVSTLEKLTHVQWSKPCHQLRSTAVEFRQRYIDMSFRVQGDVSKLGINNLLRVLESDHHSHACIFVNFKSECAKWAEELELKIASSLLDVDVVQITGDQDKYEKFAYTRLFTSSAAMDDYHPRVLVATAAANTGIDQVLVKWVLTVGIPRCLTTLLQERGRNRAEGLYLVLTDWKLFIKLLLSILAPKKGSVEEEQAHDYANSMIMTRSPEKRGPASATDPPPVTFAPLSNAAKHAVIVGAYNDLIDVVNFLFLPGLGCIHLRAEKFLWKGDNTRLLTDWPNDEHPACGDKCWVCRSENIGDMLPVIYEGAVEFLDSEHFSGREVMPYAIMHEQKELVIDQLWKSSDWKKKVFGYKNVAKYHVNAFFFQLIATGILAFRWVNAKTGVVCEFGTDSRGVIKYKLPRYWEGMQFRKPGRGGETIAFSTIMKTK